jgi:hypothetical protein
VTGSSACGIASLLGVSTTIDVLGDDDAVIDLCRDYLLYTGDG